jgi:hypothetical protein
MPKKKEERKKAAKQKRAMPTRDSDDGAQVT